LAGTITAIATLITAIGGLVLAFTVVIPLFKTAKSTHRIVNQQRTDMLNFQRALVRTLVEHGIKPPIDQSLSDESQK
jgi:hypothetical protein